jgi:hypothetical protein
MNTKHHEIVSFCLWSSKRKIPPSSAGLVFLFWASYACVRRYEILPMDIRELSASYASLIKGTGK